MQTLQVICNSVIAHVNGGIAQTLHHEGMIPGKLRTKAVSTRTSPLVKPRKSSLKRIPSFVAVGVHARE